MTDPGTFSPLATLPGARARHAVPARGQETGPNQGTACRAPTGGDGVRRYRIVPLPVVAAVLLVLAVGCSKKGPPPELAEIPQPALEAMEPAVRRQLTESFDRVLALRQDPAAEPSALGQAYGALGQLYHAYELFDAAEAAYTNAEALQPEEFRWTYYLGNLHQALGELEAATSDYRRALELKPKEVPALARLGRLLIDRGQSEEATGLLERALELDPGCAAAHFGLGKAAQDRGDHREAVEHYSKALELQPQATIVHYPLSLAHRALGEAAAADQHLARRGTARIDLPDPWMGALESLAQGTGAFLTRGGQASQQGRLEEAVEEYRQAVLAAPENPTARRDLAFALAESGRVEEAFPELEKALELDPRNPLTHNALGALKAQRGEIESAVVNFEAAVAADPDFEDALFNLAAAELYLGRRESAARHLNRVLEINPQHSKAHLLRARSLAADRDYEAAREALVRALEINPQDIDARLNLAEIAEGLGDADEALAQFRKVAAAAPPTPGRARVHYRLAELLRQRQDLEGAVRHYRLALADDPALGEARFNLAGTLGLLGRYRELLPEYQQLRTATPQSEVVRLGEATALAYLGRYGELKTRLEEGVETIPQSAALGLLLSRLLAISPQADLRDPQRALELAREAFSALPNLPSAETLAIALAAAGQHREAAEHQQGILQQAGEGLDPKTRARLEGHLARYRAGRGCCPDLQPGEPAVDALFGGLYGR